MQLLFHSYIKLRIYYIYLKYEMLDENALQLSVASDSFCGPYLTMVLILQWSWSMVVHGGRCSPGVWS